MLKEGLLMIYERGRERVPADKMYLYTMSFSKLQIYNMSKLTKLLHF